MRAARIGEVGEVGENPFRSRVSLGRLYLQHSYLAFSGGTAMRGPVRKPPTSPTSPTELVASALASACTGLGITVLELRAEFAPADLTDLEVGRVTAAAIRCFAELVAPRIVQDRPLWTHDTREAQR